jgi:hypothetical protein
VTAVALGGLRKTDLKWLLGALGEAKSGSKEDLVQRVVQSRGPVKRMAESEKPHRLPASAEAGELADDQRDVERRGRAILVVSLEDHVIPNTASRPGDL